MPNLHALVYYQQIKYEYNAQLSGYIENVDQKWLNQHILQNDWLYHLKADEQPLSLREPCHAHMGPT
jgi:hypothetical protein